MLNKFEKRGSEDALRAIRKQVRRNRNVFDAPDEDLPVIATVASQFADPGVDRLWQRLAALLEGREAATFHASAPTDEARRGSGVIPPERALPVRDCGHRPRPPCRSGRRRRTVAPDQHLRTAAAQARARNATATADDLEAQIEELMADETIQHGIAALDDFRETAEAYRSGEYTYHVRGKPFTVPTTTESRPTAPSRRWPAAHQGRRRPLPVHRAREPARALPVHCGRVPLQAPRRAERADVRR